MTRRGFLKRLGVGIAAFALTRQLSGILPDPPRFSPPVDDLGISMRLVKHFDVATDHNLTRLDVMYGWTASRPDFAVRVVSEPVPWWRRMFA